MNRTFKKLVAVILSAVLLITTAIGTAATNDTEVTYDISELVWDGTTQTKPSKGTGTEEDPYLISTPEELAYLNAAYIGTYNYYKLTDDIYLNDITKINWQDGTVEDGYTVNQWYKNATPNWFSGVLDGDGHTVYGMYVTDETNEIHLGLIQGTKNNNETKAIKNLAVDYAYVNAPNGDVSAFIGLTQSGTATFDTCYVGTNVTLTGNNAGSFCGRAGTSLIISKSYSLANVTGTTRYGAAVGDCWGGTRTIENSFFINAPITSHTGHGFTCTNVYATDITGAIEGATEITFDNMQGYDVLTNSNKMSNLSDCGAFIATKGYPVLSKFPDSEIVFDPYVWDGTTQTKPSKGTGTEEDPYLISTPEELAYLNAVYVGPYTYYKLTDDIYLNKLDKINWQDGTVEDGYTVNQWYKNTTPNWFSGVLDGDGHTVYGMYVTDETNDIHLGLIQGTKNNSDIKAIKNLGVDYAYVNAPNGDAAAFIGLTQSGTATFDTCYVGANVTLTGNNAGSFCGRAGTALMISKSYSLANVTGTTRYGAVVGDCWNATRTIENSFFINGPITSHTGHGFTCTNVYATDITGAIEGATKLPSNNMQGLDALTNANKMFTLAGCGAFTATKGYPLLSKFPYSEIVFVPYIWDGTTQTKPSKGTGTEEDPYLISTPEELAYVIGGYYAHYYYKLTTDIYLNDITKINWHDGTAEDGYTVNQWFKNATPNWFAGAIDGDGHTIFGLYVTDETNDIYLGLLQGTRQNNQTSIKNLGVDYAYVSAPNGVAAAFIGYGYSNNTTTFDTCYVGANVTVNGKVAGLFYGSGASSLAISKSYSLGTVTGTTYGVVGDCWGSPRTIDNSFFVNAPITSKIANFITCTNVYSTNATGGKGGWSKTIENMQGFGALKSSTKMIDLADCNAFMPTAGYPVLRKFPYSAVEYTVTFNPNGGTVSTESIKAVAGAVNEFPTPVKDGFIFKAWYADKELTTQATNIMPAKNVTYYAKWYKLYDVNNDGEVGSLDLTQLRKVLLESISLKSNEISIDGADCNQDAQIDVIDLVRLKKALAGVQINSRIPEGYRLVWNDEFDGNELSADKWSYDADLITSDVVKNRENITVSNGAVNLFVTYDAENEVYVRPTDIMTSNTVNIKYGYIEMKAKMPNCGMGEWPALWLLSHDANISKDESNYVQYDYNVEIDIMEKINTTDRFQSQLHLWGINNSIESISNILKNNNKTFENLQEASDWHIYALKWTEDKLIFYLDGEIYCTYDIPDEYKENMGVYMNLILSMQYVTPSSADEDYFVNNPNSKLSFEVDYVRVYQNSLTDSLLLK